MLIILMFFMNISKQLGFHMKKIIINFHLICYHNKFTFNGNKKFLTEKNIRRLFFFSNYGFESFSHLMNDRININNKISFDKFEEIIHFF